MSELFLRETFRQAGIVDRFLAGDFPSVEELKEAMFLAERSNDRTKPDYYYRNAFENVVGEWNSWRDVVRGTLNGLSSTFLERGGRVHICVRYDRFADWQHVLPEIPPLAVVTWRLFNEFGPLPFGGGADVLRTHIGRFITPQLRHSTLPTVHEPRLDHLIEREGLDDLHVHLNGSSEMERVWLDALEHPLAFAKAFKKGERNKLVQELLGQHEAGLTHAKFATRVRLASRLQRLLVRVVMPALLVPGDTTRRTPVKPDQVDRLFPSWALLLEEELPGVEEVTIPFLPRPPDRDEYCSLAAWPAAGPGHPLHRVFPFEREVLPPLTAEAVLLSGAFQRMDEPDGELVSAILFLYLSLMCLFGKVIVQQRDQIGFDQFQKITVSEVRERLEKDTYVDRLRQAEYTETGDVEVLEGRFAPKETVRGCLDLLRGIDKSYITYLGNTQQTFEEVAPTGAIRQMSDGRRKVELRLIAHFVKKEDKREVTLCRHYRLRRSLRRQACSIVAAIGLRRCRPEGKVPIVGFDAASNELHAPPEVFAPIFRYIRNHDHQNFTYHAGEDFVHLASGIRTVVEAVRFLDLKTGNRIGHGTSLGIDPALWRSRIGGSVTLRSLEWLDNLVWARDCLIQAGAISKAVAMDRAINPLCSRIYGKSHPPEMLFRSWSLRHLDPLVALGSDGTVEDTLNQRRRNEFDLISNARSDDQEAYQLWLEYHSDVVCRRGSEWITLGDDKWLDTFDAEMLGLMQEQALIELQKRRLVLETLPTSNVRISFYNGHHEHHVLRWLGVTGDAAGVPVVMGSDDPGIFATNMRNEFAHLLRELDNSCGGGAQEAMSHAEALVKNGKIWRFKPSVT